MVSKVSFLTTWPFWTSWFWYNQVLMRSEFFSPARLNAEFSPPIILLSLSWSRSDILRDNFLVVQLWNTIFFTQCQVLDIKLFLTKIKPNWENGIRVQSGWNCWAWNFWTFNAQKWMKLVEYIIWGSNRGRTLSLIADNQKMVTDQTQCAATVWT